jgi:nucleoside-diphosphate-sugar epimerase
VAGSDREAAHAAARLGELQRSVLDPELAARELGFRAIVELEDGLQATWEWLSGDPEPAGERRAGDGGHGA